MMMHAMDHSGHATQTTHTSAPHAEHESLLDILKRCYALGEITQAQFEEMSRVLALPSATPNATVEHAQQ
jgi:uncharacterized membrane protein